MKIYCSYILVFGVNIIVCLPQLNQHESSLNVTAENDGKSIVDERSLRDNNIKDKEDDADHLKSKVLENMTEIVSEKVDKDVLNMNEGMYTNQRLIPIYYSPYYGQAEHVVPRRWLPEPRHKVPIAPKASEQIVVPAYDVSFEKDVSQPEVVSERHINKPIIKSKSINPSETVYVVPKISYTPGPAEPIIPTPYLPISVDPDNYNPQETDVHTKPLNYLPPFVQPRYFRINGPYYRHPVHPQSLPRYTDLYLEPLLLSTSEKRPPGDIQEQRPGKSTESTANDNDGYNHHGYYPRRPHNTDNNNQNSQPDNNFESLNIDTTKISGFVNPDAYDFNNFDRGHPIYFPLNKGERQSQVIYNPYKNPKLKQTPENTMNISEDSDSIHNNDNATHEIDLNGQNNQVARNLDQNSKVYNSFEILTTQKIKDSLSDKTHITFNVSQLNPALFDEQNFADLKFKIKTQLQPSYDIEKGYNEDQKTDTSQTKGPLEDSDKSILNNGDSSTAGKNTVVEKINVQKTTKENNLINGNDIQALNYTENIHDDGCQENIEDSVITTTTTKENDTKYNYEINIYQLKNEPGSPENLNHEKSSENNDEECEKSNTENDMENNNMNEKTFSEITSANQETGGYSDDQKPKTEDKKLNLETYKNKNESNKNEVGDKNSEKSKYKTIEYERLIHNDSNKKNDDKSDKEEHQQTHITEHVKVWHNNKGNVASVNLKPKITITNYNDDVTKFKEQSQNGSYLESESEAIDIKHLEEVTTASEKTNSSEQNTPARTSIDTESNEDNKMSLNKSHENNDDFLGVTSASQTIAEDSIKSKQGFTMTCIRHPVDINMTDDNLKNTAEPMRLKFYKNVFEEYYKNHNVIPLTVTHKDIRSYVYKNGTIVDIITEVVWNVGHDEEPVERRTTKIIKHRRKKISKQD